MNFWTIPSSRIDSGRCMCGALDCRACYPGRPLLVIDCPECDHPHDAEDGPTECAHCGADLDGVTVREMRR